MATKPPSSSAAAPPPPPRTGDGDEGPTFLDDDAHAGNDLVPGHVSVTNIRREFGWREGEPLDEAVARREKGG